MCHAAKSIVLSFAAQWISVSGRCWEGKALKRNWSFGRTDTKPIQDRYESGVCCANPCKTDTGKKLVGVPSALQQNPRSTQSVPNKSASSSIYKWAPGLGATLVNRLSFFCHGQLGDGAQNGPQFWHPTFPVFVI